MPSDSRTVVLGALAVAVGVAVALAALAVSLPACTFAEPCRVGGGTQAVLFVVLSLAAGVAVTGLRRAWRAW